ncbi:MAG: redoxin domain-containing protein [Phycisphaerales bacterium]|nr:redoxin domain-containing protein [Phycisphaerales bacterium]
MPRILTSIVAGLVLTAGLAVAQDAADSAETNKPKKVLTVGDKAPSIKHITWIKGEPVESFAKGKAYVVECWATWCGPCIRGIPHLTKLQKEYKDKVRILGIAIWERGDNPLPTVKKFVTAQGDKMDYTVGMEQNNSIAEHWMKPAGQNGIPCAYLVGKDGHIEWIGHPGTIDPVLKSYVDGTWDREAFATEFRKTQERERVMDTLYDKLYAASSSGDLSVSIKIIDEAIAKHPDMPELEEMKFRFMLRSEKHAKDAYALGEKIITAHWDDSQMLNAMSWDVLDNPDVKHRDINFALKAAERANNLTDGKDPAILDTLARAWFDKGEMDKAIAIQEKAVEHAEEGQMKDELKATLKKYIEAQPKVG